MLSKTDARIAALKIKDLSANLAGQLLVPEIDIKLWMDALFIILLDFNTQYRNRQFALVIQQQLIDLDNAEKLNSGALWEYISRGIECFQIDLENHFSLSNLSSSEIQDLSEYCYQHKIPAFHVCGEEISLYNHEGRCIAFYNCVHPQVANRNRTALTARSYLDYKIVIDEQAARQLNTKLDEIWVDRSKRTLIGNRQTEKVLQTFLFHWLYDNIHDARVVKEVGKISGIDRTDIELTSISTGENIIIEVKWMGKNANGSKYDISRLKEGICQVCTYLEREPSAIEGCVVCYDGRQESEKDTPFSLDKPIAKLDYRIIWLESKSGSEIGVGSI